MTVNLKIITSKVCYDLSIARKYTIIQGDSGTGKSVLTEFVRLCAMGKNNLVDIRCNLEVNAYNGEFDNIDSFLAFLKGKRGIVILDEDSFAFCKINPQEIANILKSYELYFVLITREAQLFKQVKTTVYDIFELYTSGKYNKFKRTYKECLEAEDVCIDKIITEDEKSGYLFMKEYFPDINITSAGGNKNLPKELYNSRDTTNLLFYDAISAGFIETEIQRIAAGCKTRTYLFRPLSFEKYLLDSPFLKSIEYKDDMPIEDLEDFYVKVLKDNLPHGYVKGSLPNCVKRDCTEVKMNGYSFCEDCKLQDYTRHKRELVVYGILTRVRRK